MEVALRHVMAQPTSAATAAAAEPASCLSVLLALLDTVPGLRWLVTETSEGANDQCRMYAFIDGAMSCNYDPCKIREMANAMLVSGHARGHDGRRRL